MSARGGSKRQQLSQGGVIMRRSITVVLMIAAFMSGMGLRSWWESVAHATACVTPDWCEDYNTCTVPGCQVLYTTHGCIADHCAVCCDWTSTRFDCNGDFILDCVDVHFTGPACGNVECI